MTYISCHIMYLYISSMYHSVGKLFTIREPFSRWLQSALVTPLTPLLPEDDSVVFHPEPHLGFTSKLVD